ncbi:hypothetical protein KVR01_008980 [Diaporthe batatas]|uniref:uncharacterized protein n=1 Tax=Diaporthe batatas TaxID=748121 RepID=UPI001D04D8A3|nr:uncharacterized protein KVR01_008980 [Diaporthe batatas]KAG8160716.1 hypothetical protein KVR01_008980 [Diaporthe batatas]
MDPFADVDEQTARLIVQLQLQDVKEVCPNANSDFACALTMYENDLKAVSDRDMAWSIAHAVRADGPAIKEVLSEAPENAPANDDDIDDGLLEKMSAVYMGDGNLAQEEEDIYNEDSAPTYLADPSKKAPVAHLQCCTCRDDVPFYDVAHTPCGHDYCRGCLQELFRLSVTDETLFPPRCCRQPIPADQNRFFLTSKLYGDFQARKVEMETPDRTYCHAPECSKFIAPQNIQHQIGRCVACDAQTCSVCKAAAHAGECPEDPATKVLDKVAAENGWMRCKGCQRIVDLMAGCNHITCPCGAQFCYLCGETWKTCTCVVYTEAQLLRRENVVAARDAEAGRRVDLPRIRQQILDNHACTDHRWRWVPGAHRCEECHHRLPDYIFECNHCRLQACNRCRRNRL